MQVTLPDELVERLQAAAQVRGKTLEQWLGDTVNARADERQWQDLLNFGREAGRDSEYTEEDVPRIVKVSGASRDKRNDRFKQILGAIWLTERIRSAMVETGTRIERKHIS